MGGEGGEGVEVSLVEMDWHTGVGELFVVLLGIRGPSNLAIYGIQLQSFFWEIILKNLDQLLGGSSFWR